MPGYLKSPTPGRGDVSDFCASRPHYTNERDTAFPHPANMAENKIIDLTFPDDEEVQIITFVYNVFCFYPFV